MFSKNPYTMQIECDLTKVVHFYYKDGEKQHFYPGINDAASFKEKL